jgi:uncharacterized phiE125 gp8 family phage protein
MRKIKTEPTTEPLTLSEAKIFLKVDNTDEDTLITNMIKAVRRAAEIYMGRALISQTWYDYRDEFPDDWFEITLCPVTSITSVKYYDADDAQQTLSAAVYLTDIASEPARISLAIGQSWPSISGRQNSVCIEYVCGWSNAGAVPDLIKAGMYLHLGHLYENRQDVTKEKMNELPGGSRSLYDMYRVY